MKKPDFDALRKMENEFARTEKLSLEEKYRLLEAMNSLTDLLHPRTVNEPLISEEKLDFIKRLHDLPRATRTNS